MLTLNSLSITSPSPSQFLVSMDATIATGGGVAAHANLDAMDIDLYMSDDEDAVPFMTLPLDALHGADFMQVKKVNQQVNITEAEELSKFADTLMANQTLSFSMHGRTKVWIGKLNAKVNYDETVEMKGMLSSPPHLRKACADL